MEVEKAILHSDLNAFYCSVEMMLDPSLRGRAVAVCGNTEERHGIVLAKSEKAKKAGVKTGMAAWQARQKCPELLLVPPQYEQYLKYSRLAHEIYYRYTDLVEPFGMDECWLDVTDSRSVHGTGPEIAEKIRNTMREELGLTVSIGVSFNKIYAKLGSDMKKPDAVTVLDRQNYRDRVWPLPVSELLYVGRATNAKLRSYGVQTIGELAALDPALLHRWFGINGVKLWQYANGADGARVMHRDFVSPIKSIGHGITCRTDLLNNDEVWKVMLELSQDVGHRLRVHGLTTKGVQVYVRENDLFGNQYQCKLPLRTQLPSELAEAGFRQFRERYSWANPVRALCIRAIDLEQKQNEEQLSLFIDHGRRDRRDRLEETIESVRSRFGNKALTYAVLMGDLKMPSDGRELVKMPNPMYTAGCRMRSIVP